jgi:hypothetical protein
MRVLQGLPTQLRQAWDASAARVDHQAVAELLER